MDTSAGGDVFFGDTRWTRVFEDVLVLIQEGSLDLPALLLKNTVETLEKKDAKAAF